ncbi:MAG: hypothetical protein JEY99_00045 [Spirochaetales bacterium]|nr:hypothetical protein [Spirochaetales bacterium]
MALFVNIMTYFGIRSYKAGSESMAPVLPLHSRFMATPVVFGNQIPLTGIKIPGFRAPDRGDVVLVKPSYISNDPVYVRFLDSIIRFFTLQRVSINSTEKKEWENSILVKRIIGVPGDQLRIEGFKVMIKPEGENRFLSEKNLLKEGIEIVYPEFPENWDYELPFSGNLKEVILKEGEYLLLSDSRGKGSDGLLWGFSSEDEILQKVFLRYWPNLGVRL